MGDMHLAFDPSGGAGGLSLVGPDGNVKPEMRAMILGKSLQDMVGTTFVIKFLTSERGRALNGKVCRAIGHNGERCEVAIQETGAKMRIKMNNLLAQEHAHTPPHGPGIPLPELLTRLSAAAAAKAVENQAGTTNTLHDSRARVAFVRSHVSQGRAPPPLPCCEPMVPATGNPAFMEFMRELRPCCAGDGTVVFSRFSDGLVGNGSECHVCMEPVAEGSPALTFPCGHMFHKPCACGWLAGHNTCPSCRMKLGMPGQEYIAMFDYEQRVTVRLLEWFQAGMCERCQAVIMEKDPLVMVPGPDGAMHLVRRSDLPPGYHAAASAAHI